MNAGKSLRQVCDAGGDTIVTGLATDSRRVAPCDLFLARAGALHDAHEHVPEAVRRGAVAVCSERPVATIVPNVVIPKSPGKARRHRRPLLRRSERRTHMHRRHGNQRQDLDRLALRRGCSTTPPAWARWGGGCHPTCAPPR